MKNCLSILNFSKLNGQIVLIYDLEKFNEQFVWIV